MRVIKAIEKGRRIKNINAHVFITERKALEKKLKESEKRFSDLAKSIPGVIYQWQEDYTGTFSFTYISPKLKECFDIEPQDMAKLIDYVHPDDIAGWRKSVEVANKTGNPWKYEGRLLYPCGKIKWWRGQSDISAKNKKGIVYNGIMTDITEEMAMREMLEEKKKKNKRQMLQAIITAQEKERQLISYELHDNVNQVLATTKLIIDLIDINNSSTFDFIGQSKANIEMAMEEIRSISHGLNSGILNMIGLSATIRGMLQKINSTNTIVFNFEDSAAFNECLSKNKEVELAFFRIIQSQITNVLKHSHASQATISLFKKYGCLALTVADNGIGFNADNTNKGLGLVNIFNRAELFNGEVSLISTPGAGCTLSVFFPIKN